MPYTKTNYIDGQAPALSASNLNNTENGVETGVTHAESTHAPSDATPDQSASGVPVTPAGNLTSTDVQAALEELQVELDNLPATDPDNVVYDVAGTFTEAQRTNIDSSSDNSIAFDDGNNFAFTATGVDITVTNQTVGQSGTLVISSSDLITAWSTNFDWGNQGVPTDLSGEEIFSYFISGASGVDSIKIGRV